MRHERIGPEGFLRCQEHGAQLPVHVRRVCVPVHDGGIRRGLLPIVPGGDDAHHAAINTFAYDEQSGWEKLAAATPAGRRGVVGAKYLFTVLLLAVGLALCAGIQASMYAFGIHGDGTLGEGLESAMITVCAAAS